MPEAMKSYNDSDRDAVILYGYYKFFADFALKWVWRTTILWDSRSYKKTPSWGELEEEYKIEYGYRASIGFPAGVPAGRFADTDCMIALMNHLFFLEEVRMSQELQEVSVYTEDYIKANIKHLEHLRNKKKEFEQLKDRIKEAKGRLRE